jgi:hypothetical protein
VEVGIGAAPEQELDGVGMGTGGREDEGRALPAHFGVDSRAAFEQPADRGHVTGRRRRHEGRALVLRGFGEGERRQGGEQQGEQSMSQHGAEPTAWARDLQGLLAGPAASRRLP